MTWLQDLLGPGAITGWDILWALLSTLVGWILSVFAFRGAAALLRKTPNVSEGVALVVARIVKYGVILLGVGIGLSFLGASVQPVLAITLIVVVVMALALRGIAANFAAGIVLQTRHPIKLGNEIEVNGITGTVTELNGRSVVLHTVDGRVVHVPNGMLLSEPIVNHSERETRRSEVRVRMERPASEIKEVIDRLTTAVAAVEDVHSRQPVHTIAVAISPDRLTLDVRFWHHPLKAVSVSSAVVLALSLAVDAAGYTATVTSEPGVPPLVSPDEP